ncbi:gastrin-releasing peptide receptor-like [Antedon mediterranea]|uniref:gastrin-releasing peptide receptor-like n=1 Tax=Antedon mediterranea TaxID=105859 RepID=UPI003AF84F8D
MNKTILLTTERVGLSTAVATTTEISTWVLVFEVILGIMGTFGNLIICIVIIYVKTMHSLTNYLILSLAVADLLSSILLIINVFPVDGLDLEIPNSVILAEIFCRTYNNLFFFWICLTASVFNLVCVTMERFFALVYPLFYERYFTLKKVWIMVVATWIVAFVQEIAAPFVSAYDPETNQCVYGFKNTVSQRINGLTIFLISYLIPVIVMIIAYYKICRTLKIDAETSSQQASTQVLSLLSARKRVISVLIMVLGAFCVLWTPNQLVYLFQNFDIFLFSVSSMEYRLFRLMALSNSVVNSFIYGFKYKKFRKSVRIVFGRLCLNDVNSDETKLTVITSQLSQR